MFHVVDVVDAATQAMEAFYTVCSYGTFLRSDVQSD
jgi:hypothetical protein